MAQEFIILLLMLSIFALSVFLFKLPSGVALGLSAAIGAIIGGHYFPVRHLIEGSFGYLDAILIIATAMIFMKVIEATGALGTLNYWIIKYFYRFPTILIILVSFFVMLPGMLTGLSSACILTTGALVAPALLAMNIPRTAVGSLIAMTAVYGMIAPPINIPIMIIGGGVDMPYIGFEKPLMFSTFSLAIITSIYFRIKYIKKINIDEVLSKISEPLYNKHGIKLFFPVIIVIALMVGPRVVPEYIPDIGAPLIFLIGAFVGLGSGEKFNFFRLSRSGIIDALPIMVILVGVGMFVQIITLTGIRGFIAASALNLPPAFLYLGIAFLMPLFGSAYAASSVLGVPLVYVFLGKNEIIVTSALSLIAGIGDLMPPPSLLCVFAAQIVKEQNHFLILKKSAPLMILTLTVGILMIIFSRELNQLI